MEPPTVMIVGEDIQRRLIYSGWRPQGDTWGTVMGIEIRGVSDYIRGLCEGHLLLMPEHLRLKPFKTEILGEFPKDSNDES